MIGLNARIYTIRNYAARATGWEVDEAGRAQLLDTPSAWEESSIRSNIQPYLGRVRMAVGGVATPVTDRIKGDVYKYRGAFPDLIPSDNTQGLLATRVLFDDKWYEIQLVRDWTRGLMPYLYFEAEMLPDVEVTNGPATDTALDADLQVEW